MKRQYLLWMFEHKCHKAKNFGSFELFCSNVLNIEMTDHSIRQLLRYARTERAIDASKCTPRGTFPEPIAITPVEKKYSNHYLEQLSRLDTDEQKRSIHNQKTRGL